MNRLIRSLAVGALVIASGGNARTGSAASPGAAPPRADTPLTPSEVILGYAKVAANPLGSDGAERPAEEIEVRFGDGSTERVAPEMGSFTDDADRPVRQSAFDNIQLADDHRTIGWLASYMICSQSYPCAAALVLYQSGHRTHRLRPTEGIVWRWMFLPQGKQVVLQSGFPHGDDVGVYALYDVDSGRLLESFVTGSRRPDWVRALEGSQP